MKTRIYTQFCLLLILHLFIIGCNNTKKDWEKTKQSNSIEEVKKFLATNPESKFDQEAKFFLDSLEWISILKTKKVDSLDLFLKGHSGSQFLAKCLYALDSIYWKIAFYSQDSIKLRDYIKRFSNSKNAIYALNLINQLEWAPTLFDESKNSFKIIFPKDTTLTFNNLKQRYHWNNEEFVYSIGKSLAVINTQNGSSYAISSRDEGHSISCNFPTGVWIIGDFAFGNLKFFKTRATGKDGGVFFTKGTELIFSIPKNTNSSK